MFLGSLYCSLIHFYLFPMIKKNLNKKLLCLGVQHCSDHGSDSSNEVGTLSGTPLMHLRLHILDRLVAKSIHEGMAINGNREVKGLQEFIVVRWNCTLHCFNAMEAMKVCDFTFIMVRNEEVVGPGEGPGDVYNGCAFISRVGSEGIASLAVWSSQLRGVKTGVDHGQHFEDNVEPVVVVEDSIRGIERRGNHLLEAAKGRNGHMGDVIVGNVVEGKGVLEVERRGSFIMDEKSKKVVKGG